MEQYTSQEKTRRIISNMVKKRNSIVSLVLLWLFDGTLKWIRSAFKEGMKVMQKYAILTNINALPHEVGLGAPRT